jgi:PAS domain S-box-containing protein
MVPLPADWTRQVAWFPIPLLLTVIAGLWVADLQTAYESRTLMVLLNVFFTWLAALCICFLTARGFLDSGQPGLLMFGCGSLLWGVTSLAAAVIVDRLNPTITVHNVGVLGAALCHLVGSLWRGRLPRPGHWLVVGYACALITAALLVWAAMAGLTPVFFVQGHGGTPLRQAVLLLATALFAWVAWQMIYRFRRQSGAFYYWYGLGLALVATGLTGVMLLSVQGGILGWTNRLTQYLGSAYLFIAALMAARQTGTWTFSLTAVNEALQKYWFMAEHRRQQTLFGWMARHSLAAAVVAVAFGLRLALPARFGSELPPYVTFYPAVMLVALLAGFGPGLLATALTGLLVCYWILPPVGQFAIASPVDRVGLVIFAGMGVLMSVVAELYRRSRDKAAAYDREAELHESREKLRLALRSASMGAWRFDLRSRRRHFDEHVCRCLGIDPARFAGTEEEFFAAVHPDDCEGLRNAMARTLAGSAAYEVEYRAVWPDGSLHYIAARGQLARDANEEPLWIDGLLWDVTDRKRADERIRASLREKEVLLKEIHHRVKNNMQVISSLVALQAERLPDAAMRAVLQDVTHRVRSMALVHEKLYQSADMAQVQFAEYAQSLLNYLWRAHETTAPGIRLALDLEPVQLSVNAAVPCGLVLNELASNALKHAFHSRADGEVSVVLRGSPEGRVCLRVRDNGTGLPAGLDWRQADTLGLRLVQMLAGQLDATVDVHSNKGTEFTVTFGGPQTIEDGKA